MSGSQFVSLHVPLVDGTRGLVNADRLKLMPQGAVLLNFSRAEIVDEDAVLESAGRTGHLKYYVCDFPSEKLRGHERVITLPHLGASTDEAEDNSAIMIADQMRDWLEVGNIRNSVNFPEAIMPPTANAHRIVVINKNQPNMVGQITSALARHNHNIADLLNKSKGEIALVHGRRRCGSGPRCTRRAGRNFRRALRALSWRHRSRRGLIDSRCGPPWAARDPLHAEPARCAVRRVEPHDEHNLR